MAATSPLSHTIRTADFDESAILGHSRVSADARILFKILKNTRDARRSSKEPKYARNPRHIAIWRRTTKSAGSSDHDYRETILIVRDRADNFASRLRYFPKLDTPDTYCVSSYAIFVGDRRERAIATRLATHDSTPRTVDANWSTVKESCDVTRTRLISRCYAQEKFIRVNTYIFANA